jgi:hypothetical protein
MNNGRRHILIPIFYFPLHNLYIEALSFERNQKTIFTQRSMKMKKTLLIVGLAALALGVFGVGVVFAQSGQPPYGGYGPMMNGAGPLHTYMVAAFADKLHLTVDEVNAKLAGGETMYSVALANGVAADDFPAFMADVRTAALDAALKDGVITQQQADWMKTHGFGRGGYGYGSGNCPMFDNDANGQFGPGSGYGPGMMGRGGRWQGQ